MTALARLRASLPTEDVSLVPARRGTPDLTLAEVLGRGRLRAAAELGDDTRVDELLDVLLDHPYLGRRLAGRVIVRTGQALANHEGSTP